MLDAGRGYVDHEDVEQGHERRGQEHWQRHPKSTWSHHLRVLREAGVMRARHDGTWKFVSLRRTDLDRRFPGLLDAVLQGARSEFAND